MYNKVLGQIKNMTNMKNIVYLSVASLFILISLTYLATTPIWPFNKEDKFAQCRNSKVTGGSASIGGTIELVAADGSTVSDFEIFSKPSLVYFGYTFCPDVCPLHVSRNADAVDMLEERSIQTTPVFISIDPTRDTPEVLQEFAEMIHPRMVTYTGSEEQIRSASKAYRTYYKKQESDDLGLTLHLTLWPKLLHVLLKIAKFTRHSSIKYYLLGIDGIKGRRQPVKEVEKRTIGEDNSLLILDDDEPFLRRLAKAMEKRGFAVETAGSIAAGSAIATARTPAYAVIDLRLADGNGLDVVEILRSKRPDCRIVVLTGYGAIATAVAAVKIGATDYLSKPADANDVINALLTRDDELPPPPENPMSADRVRWEHIQRVYELCDRNVSETARRLNMHRRTLQRILAKRSPK